MHALCHAGLSSLWRWCLWRSLRAVVRCQRLWPGLLAQPVWLILNPSVRLHQLFLWHRRIHLRPAAVRPRLWAGRQQRRILLTIHLQHWRSLWCLEHTFPLWHRPRLWRLPRLPLGRQVAAYSGSRPPSQLLVGACLGSRAHQALGLGSPSQPLEEAASLTKPAHRRWVQACLAGRTTSTSHLRAASSSRRTNTWCLRSLLVSAQESVLRPSNTLSCVPSGTASGHNICMKSCSAVLSWDMACPDQQLCARPELLQARAAWPDQSCHCRGGDQPLWHAASGARGGNAPDPREQSGHRGKAHVRPGAPSPGSLCGSPLPDAPFWRSPEAKSGAQGLAVLPPSPFRSVPARSSHA